MSLLGCFLSVYNDVLFSAGTGGLLGLFIGASVLTLLEVFELIGFSVNYNINKYIRKTYDIN